MHDECEDCGYYDCQCEDVTGPAPKENEMPYDVNCTCCKCTEERERRALNPYDPKVTVEQLNAEQHETSQRLNTETKLRAVWERAYFAALFQASPSGWTHGDIIESARCIANATISAWPAMTAERDALIRKAVEG